MGLPQKNYLNPIFEQWLPDAVKKTRPDVPYVVGSPSGGALPFSVDSGPAHYFGVGGYRRPLDDARRANVAFASECLAFANVPEPYAASQGEAPLTGVSDPRWKSRVPRDVGSSWDFEDVRDYYLELLFGQHAGQLRAQDPERYLMLSRATPVAVMDAVFSEWTRKGSRTRGGLVLMLQDFVAGAGWGLVSACSEPKSAWYGLKRLFKPLRVCMTDEGVNGLDLHVTNETATARQITLELSVVRDGRTPLLNVKRNIDLAPRSVQSINAYDMMGRFFDFSYAYRFQAPQHDATIARLIDPETGFVLCEVVHFPMGHTGPMSEAGVTASVQQTNGDWFLKLEASKLVRFLHITDPSFRAEDNWFHLAPFSPRLIKLVPRRAGRDAPHGEIHALNLLSPISFEA
jgi:beta-mannosidase